MLGNSTIYTTIAVKDIAQAMEFYEGTLGLRQIDDSPGGVTYQSGTGMLFVYQAPSAGTSQATCAAWEVEDVEATIEDLKAAGIMFEHYDIPGATTEGDVMVMGQKKAAWFKDPSGNILSVGN